MNDTDATIPGLAHTRPQEPWEKILDDRDNESGAVPDLDELKAELERREEVLREGEKLLAERERFVEESEALLQEKSQALMEAETRLEQLKEDLARNADRVKSESRGWLSFQNLQECEAVR